MGLSHTNTTSWYVLTTVFISIIGLPVTLPISAFTPLPLVPVLSKRTPSPTVYPIPELTTLNDVTLPFVVDSTSAVCSTNSFDSTIKSLSEKVSAKR